MGAKIGRNDPCPCGSGKKYKKCCLPREENLRRENARLAPLGYTLGYTDLDELSNRTNTLIRAGRFDEAAEACARLRREYPDMVDGLQRQAQLDEARGLPAEAARYYRAAADLAATQDGFDDESLREWRERADELDSST